MRENVATVIARGLEDAAAQVVTNVPGFGGTQVFEAWSRRREQGGVVSFHEEVAYAVAHGASLVGARSATLLKAHARSGEGGKQRDGFAERRGAGRLCARGV